MKPEVDGLIRGTVEAAEREITEINVEVARLTFRRIELQRYAVSGRRVLGERPVPVLSGDEAIWEVAAAVLGYASRALTVPEVVDEMRLVGRTVHGENAVEVVRVAMNRKPEVFARSRRGFYALKEAAS